MGFVKVDEFASPNGRVRNRFVRSMSFRMFLLALFTVFCTPARAFLGTRTPNAPVEAGEGDRRLLVMSARIMDESYLDGNETTYDRLFGDSGLASSSEMVMYCPSPSSPDYMFAPLPRVMWPYVWYDNLAYPLGVWDPEIYSEQLFCMAWDCDFLCGVMQAIPDPSRDDYMGGTIIRMRDFAKSRDAVYEFVGRGGEVHFKASIRCDQCYLEARRLPPEIDSPDLPPTPPAGGAVDEPVMPPSGGMEELASRCENLCKQNLPSVFEGYMLECVRLCIENEADLGDLQEFLSALPPIPEPGASPVAEDAPVPSGELQALCQEYCRENLPGFTLEILLQRCVDECIQGDGNVNLDNILDYGSGGPAPAEMIPPNPAPSPSLSPPIQMQPLPPSVSQYEGPSPALPVMPEAAPEPEVEEPLAIGPVENPAADELDPRSPEAFYVPVPPAPEPAEWTPEVEPPEVPAVPPAPEPAEWTPEVEPPEILAVPPAPEPAEWTPEVEPPEILAVPPAPEPAEWTPEVEPPEIPAVPPAPEPELVETGEVPDPAQIDDTFIPPAMQFESLEPEPMMLDQQPHPSPSENNQPFAPEPFMENGPVNEPQASALGTGKEEEVSDKDNSPDTSIPADVEPQEAPTMGENPDNNAPDSLPPSKGQASTNAESTQEDTQSGGFPAWVLAVVGVIVIAGLAVGSFLAIRHVRRRRALREKNISVESLAARLAKVGKDGRPVAVHASETWSPFSRRNIQTPFGPAGV